MCIRSHSESGQPCGFEPCKNYKGLLEYAERLAGLVERLQAENAALRKENMNLRAENTNLSMAHGPGNHTDWMLTRASKHEQLHKDLERIRQERDYLYNGINSTLHPQGDGPAAPSGCDLVGYVKELLHERDELRGKYCNLVERYDKAADKIISQSTIIEKSDALSESIDLVPGLMDVVSTTVKYVWQRYGVHDVGLPFNPEQVAEEVRQEVKAYQEARRAE